MENLNKNNNLISLIEIIMINCLLNGIFINFIICFCLFYNKYIKYRD